MDFYFILQSVPRFLLLSVNTLPVEPVAWQRSSSDTY